MKNQKTVATKSEEAQAMEPDWGLVEALMGGTPKMREAGKKYLPAFALETDEPYKNRLGVATLFPAFADTLGVMGGRVFAEDMEIGDTVPAWIKTEVLDDVDKTGRNIHVFCREWFIYALAFGLSHVLVESPIVEGTRTMEQQKKEKLRPYLIHVKPQQVLGWKEKDGKLSQLRLMFSKTEDDAESEFHTNDVNEVRVYDLLDNETVQVRVFEKVDEEWAEVSLTVLDAKIKAIPFLTYYTKREGFMVASPPLRELAYLNAKHWVKQSSADALIATASVPILVVSGVDSDTEIVIGSKHAVVLPNKDAKMGYVEHTGAAIAAGHGDLDSLKDEMRMSGAKLLLPQTGTKTAAQANEEADRENSALGAMVKDLQDTIIAMLDVIAAWRGEESGGDIEVRANLENDTTPLESMTVLSTMADRGQLSTETLFNEAQRRKIISPEIEWADEQARIKEETPEIPPMVPGVNPLDPEPKKQKPVPLPPAPLPPAPKEA
jgi:hypothetical protein